MDSPTFIIADDMITGVREILDPQPTGYVYRLGVVDLRDANGRDVGQMQLSDSARDGLERGLQFALVELAADGEPVRHAILEEHGRVS